MWILSWKQYKLSKFATFVSIIGALMRSAGVMCLFASAIPAALICIAIGIALHFCAEAIAKNKTAKTTGVKNTTKAPCVEFSQTTPTTVKSSPNIVQTSSPASCVTKTITPADGEIKCSKCGTVVSANTKFCAECGNALHTEVTKQKNCLRCGELVDNGSKFCVNCGLEIK